MKKGKEERKRKEERNKEKARERKKMRNRERMTERKRKLLLLLLFSFLFSSILLQIFQHYLLRPMNPDKTQKCLN